ncbi:hypothetical protein JIN84_20510 [Luteolibacter yonseiensis]|uniref:Uncharacterized protein n=1 Tax=Luteolibacter yonseiensis TaxID=1144680 RepID=A0A934V971_9BACT|nr:hypothetical protein [Luteolibacter yonseiensis]MBK1818017.1 hypothetical protein [Luteolibacter yonseiensis]
MKVTNFTAIIWEAISQIDARRPAPFSFQEIHEAASQGRLLDLLGRNSSSGFTRFLLVGKESGNPQVEEALGRASKVLNGQELRQALIGDNPWCLLIAMALQAIQAEFPEQSAHPQLAELGGQWQS